PPRADRSHVVAAARARTRRRRVGPRGAASGAARAPAGATRGRLTRVSMRTATRFVLVLVSAGLYGLSFPPHGSALVGWIALVPFFVALEGASGRLAVGLAWLSGVTMAWSITAFLPRAVTVYYQQSVWFGVALFVAIVSVMCCSSHMAFAWWYRLPRRSR